MRVYVTDVQLEAVAQLLREKDVACHVFPDAFGLVRAASDKASWGCVLCPIYGPTDAGWLLDAWNRETDLIEVTVIRSPMVECLIACPTWAIDDPFVRTLVRKLSGTKPPSSPVDWEKCEGLVPVTAYDAVTGEPLMQAFMDEIAFAETMTTRRAVYFSRSRRKLWRKGEESGNMQIVKEIRIDCDADSIVLKVEQVGGAACHDGYKSCFYRRFKEDGELEVIEARVFDPTQVYAK